MVKPIASTKMIDRAARAAAMLWWAQYRVPRGEPLPELPEWFLTPYCAADPRAFRYFWVEGVELQRGLYAPTNGVAECRIARATDDRSADARNRLRHYQDPYWLLPKLAVAWCRNELREGAGWRWPPVRGRGAAGEP